MDGIRGADQQCYRQSQEEKLNGTFRAFLSSSTQSLVSIGQLLAKSWSSLFNGKDTSYFNNKKFPIYTFNGRNVLADPMWTQKAAWHGIKQWGGLSSNKDCHDWQTASIESKGLASPPTGGKFPTAEMRNCSESLIVLCVENVFSSVPVSSA
ncbi:hypothetical protein lerEdw1_017715 [Lerista edwardsae]|nr:hypothetical protein lerEdw1_017715 [Lerista edwardsae]